MIRQLKKIVELHGVSYVASQLGFRSNETIYKWFRDNRIPIIREKQVREFIRKKNVKSNRKR